MARLRIAVCVKWVDLRPEIDALSGTVSTDERRFGFSSADQAALEVALRLAATHDAGVTVACAGVEAAEPAIRELAAAGADATVRVDFGAEASSETVGASLAAAVRGSDLVICGDHSMDRGSGSVPGFIAHALGVAQALGLVEVSPGALLDDTADGGSLHAVRRLDGGRRERLDVTLPAVISVEGSVARLRRAPLHEILTARSMPVERHASAPSLVSSPEVGPAQPLRPRPRSWPAPTGERPLDRIVALTGALVERTPPRRIEMPPAESADAILDQLRTWGYLE